MAFKPAELVSVSAWALVDILVRAGLPAGVLNLVMGRGSVVGEEIVTSRDVDGVSFTGSVATGQSIAAKVVARMGKVQLEMGGKNPLMITDDADLDVVVIRASDYEHALELANDTRFGLCAGIVTTSLKLAIHFKRHAQVGMGLDGMNLAFCRFAIAVVRFAKQVCARHPSKEIFPV